MKSSAKRKDYTVHSNGSRKEYRFNVFTIPLVNTMAV